MYLEQVITKVLPPIQPPPRSVIVERLPALPPKPRDIIIERWIPYESTQKRKVPSFFGARTTGEAHGLFEGTIIS